MLNIASLSVSCTSERMIEAGWNEIPSGCSTLTTFDPAVKVDQSQDDGDTRHNVTIRTEIGFFIISEKSELHELSDRNTQ